MSEQITSAMLDELERVASPYSVALNRELFDRLIAAVRRAERLTEAIDAIRPHTNLILARMRQADETCPPDCDACEDDASLVRGAAWAIDEWLNHAALTPEPPQRPQERADSPSAGGAWMGVGIAKARLWGRS